MTDTLSLAEAAAVARTGDVLLFRGRSPADRAIRAFTNSPVNHVGMVLALDDLPPLLWHAELGQSLPDVWTGERHRGTQLHRMTDAVATWFHRYGQRGWIRQIDIEVSREMEDAALRTVNELDGKRFPSPPSLVSGWLKGRVLRPKELEALFCAEVVAITFERMGLLDSTRPPNWYDPGTFWSGDGLQLRGATLGPEIAVTDIPAPEAPTESS